MTFTSPELFEEAIAKLAERRVMPSANDSVMWARYAVAIRERAFFSSLVESARVLQTMHDYLTDFLTGTRMENGGLQAQGRAEFVATMRELAIREGLGAVDPLTGAINPKIRESDLTDIRSLSRLQLIFDTQTEAAQEFGYWQQGNDPDVLWAFPALRFIRVRPVKHPRLIHQSFTGEIRRKDDLEFWLKMNPDFNVPWGPWGFNSGMGTEDVDREEAVAAGVIGETEEVNPPQAAFNQHLSASVQDLNPGISAALTRATGGIVAAGRIVAAVTDLFTL